ncbi:MAG: glycoside hydrolase family 28 protein [Acidimicrobiia bacterium]
MTRKTHMVPTLKTHALVAVAAMTFAALSTACTGPQPAANATTTAKPATTTAKPATTTAKPATTTAKPETTTTVAAAPAQASKVVTYPSLLGAARSASYSLAVNGVPVFVEKFKDISYARYSQSGSTTATITASENVSQISVSPKSYGITPTRAGNTATFTIDHPTKLVVTVNALEKFFLFVDSIETAAPRPADPGVLSAAGYVAAANGAAPETANLQRAIDAAAATQQVLYIPAGTYRTGELRLRANSRVYLAPGALLKSTGVRSDFPDYSMIFGANANNAVIFGRGEIDAQGAVIKSSGDGFRTIRFVNASNVSVNDVALRDSSSWTVHLVGVRGASLSNMKIINDLSLANIDGIDPDMSRNVTIDGAFIYTSDDCHAIKTSGMNGVAQETSSILIKNGICWTKKSALKVGTETLHDLHAITFQSNDVIHADRAMAIYIADGARAYDIHFVANKSEFVGGDIRQKLFDFNVTRRMTSTPIGSISNVEVRDWIAYSRGVNTSTITGFDASHPINQVVFTNNRVAGTSVRTAADIPMTSTNTTALSFA